MSVASTRDPPVIWLIWISDHFNICMWKIHPEVKDALSCPSNTQQLLGYQSITISLACPLEADVQHLVDPRVKKSKSEKKFDP